MDSDLSCTFEFLHRAIIVGDFREFATLYCEVTVDGIVCECCLMLLGKGVLYAERLLAPQITAGMSSWASVPPRLSLTAD